MPSLDLFEKLSLVEVSRVLDLHPFELARLLGAGEDLPRVLRFEERSVDNIRKIAGLETWWDGGPLEEADPDPRRAVVRSLMRKVLDRGLPGGPPTRADNLFRGLEPQLRGVVRKAVNQLIRERVASSSASARGLLVRFGADQVDRLGELARGEGWSPGLEAVCQ